VRELPISKAANALFSTPASSVGKVPGAVRESLFTRQAGAVRVPFGDDEESETERAVLEQLRQEESQAESKEVREEKDGEEDEAPPSAQARRQMSVESREYSSEDSYGQDSGRSSGLGEDGTEVLADMHRARETQETQRRQRQRAARAREERAR